MRTQTALRLQGFLAALVERQAVNFRQGLAALMAATAANLVAGAVLGSMTGTLERLPGLVVLVPAAIAMRGNVFGALVSRLGTAVHTGQWSGEWEGRPAADSLVGQNVAAAAVLTLHVSALAAFLAREMSRLFGLETIGFFEFLTVSVVGGLLASLFVLFITLVVAVISVRKGWDVDNVGAPLITSIGDLVTVPSLWVASLLVRPGPLPEVVGALTLLLMAAAAVHQARSERPSYRRILRQSLPVLAAAGAIDVLAGISIDARIEEFLVLPALLVLVPPLLADAGALGGILSARLASRLHLGSLQPKAFPGGAAAEDIGLTYTLALPVFLVVGVGVWVVAALTGLAGYGLGPTVAISLLAGLMATTVAILVAYYSAVLSFRLGLDPDTYGIPSVTSTLDLVGVLALVLAIGILGIST